MRTWLYTLAIIIGLSGCGVGETEVDSTREATPPETQESTVTRAVIASEWTRDGDWLVSPLFEAELGADSVGYMLEMQGTHELPPFEGRLIQDLSADGTSEWESFIASWQEDGHFVGMTEFGMTGKAAQVRIHVDALDGVVALHWNAVIKGEPGPETEVEDPAEIDTRQLLLRSELKGMGIVTREDWGARATRCNGVNRTKTKMAIHYTVTPSNNPETRVRAIQRYHQDTRGWCDMGYHFLVGTDGKVYEGRPLEYRGAHVGGHNTNNIGISFIGCFHPSGCSSMGPTTPPEAMINAGGRLLGTLSNLYGISLNNSAVRGHRDHSGASTSCPGDNLKVRIDDMLAIGKRSGLGSPPDVVAPVPPGPPVDAGACPSMGCGGCEAANGCDWCASSAACGATGGACAWPGEVGANACWDTLWPCAETSCWNPQVEFETCGTWQKHEDFSSGRFSTHRYWATLKPGGPTTIEMTRTGGSFAPAILVADRSGRMIYGGDDVSIHPTVSVDQVSNGRAGDSARVTLTVMVETDIYVYATGWSVIDAKFRGSLPRSAAYSLSASQNCSQVQPPPPSGACDTLACGDCDVSAGCSWCGSQGSCGDVASSCTWNGEVGVDACWSALWPCAIGSCWEPVVQFNRCGVWSMNEDFRTGRYSVHRYRAIMPKDGPLTLRVDNTQGDFQPAIIVADRAGKMVVAGEDTTHHPAFAVTSTISGRTGGSAETTIHGTSDQDVYVYVTDWRVLDDGFSGRVSTGAKYRFSAIQDCTGGTTPPALGADYSGLTYSGSEIPRKGLVNQTLQGVLGMWQEPYGDVVTYMGNDYVSGTVSWFGGPTDTGVSATETGAISGEVLRDLNNPRNPNAARLAVAPEEYYYAAMRWNYSPNGRNFWKNARLLVVNPDTGQKIIVRAVDWGPNTNTSRIIDLSPQAMSDLGLLTDDKALVSFAPAGSTLGPVR